MPQGVLTCHRRGNTYKWYQNFENREKKYLPRQQAALAEQLALKAYQRQKLLDICQELDAIASYLRRCPSAPGRAEQLLEKRPAMNELLKPHLRSLSEELALWEKEEYPRNPAFPEHLIVPSVRGEMMRSKSEAMIAYVLYEKSVPYRYECGHKMSGIMYYPDFTLRRPCDGKLFIWEHLGKIDDPEYLSDNASKLHIYMNNGWVPGNNLIITSETANTVFDISSIPEIVQFYLGV